MVRAAKPDDAEAIARVHTRSWQQAYTHLFTAEELAGISVDARARMWREVIGGSAIVVVGEQDGEVAGFANAGPTGDHDAPGLGELNAIYVDPEAWGRGLGRELLAEIESQLRAQGFEEALLWVAEDNPRTRRFYELAGWAADGKQRPVEFLGREISEVRYRKQL
jgi:ribosomal protein S18 acetylase RimI-like enzyme